MVLRMPRRPRSGRFSGATLSNSGRPTAPMRTASAAAESFSVSAGKGPPVLWMAMPPRRPSRSVSWCFHFSATTRRTRTASRVTSRPIPSPGSTRMLRFHVLAVSYRLGYFATATRHGRDFLVHEAVFVIGQGGHLSIDRVELRGAEIKTQLFATIFESVATAVFTQHETAFGNADRLRIDDLIRGRFLEEAILMDTGFMGEGVAADDGLVGLGSEADDGAQKLAGGEEVFGVDAGLIRIAIIAGLHDHDYLFERAVAGALADAVDGAFDLAGSGSYGGERIGYGEAEIVMAVYRYDGGIAKGFDDAADQLAVLIGRGVADGIRDIDGAGSGGDYGFRNLFEIFGVGAGSVFGGEFDVIDIVADELDGGDGGVEDFLARLLELVLQMDVAGGEEGVDAGAFGFLEGAGGALD